MRWIFKTLHLLLLQPRCEFLQPIVAQESKGLPTRVQSKTINVTSIQQKLIQWYKYKLISFKTTYFANLSVSL